MSVRLKVAVGILSQFSSLFGNGFFFGIASVMPYIQRNNQGDLLTAHVFHGCFTG